MIRVLLFGVFVLLLSSISAEAAEIIAPSGSTQDLQDAVDQANSGDVIRIPEGSFEFTGTLTFQKGITLMGAGKDKTILYRPAGVLPPGYDGRDAPDMISAFTLTEPFRISGITLIGHADHDQALDVGIRIRDSQDFRVDNCRIEGFGNAGVLVYDYFGSSEPSETNPFSRGVIDHCEIIDCFKPVVDNWGYGVAVYHGNRINSSAQPGGQEAIFIEDCLITGARHATASAQAARYVIRHSIVRNIKNNHHAIDAHGPFLGVGSQWTAVYDNLIEKPNYESIEYHNAAIILRGGEGVIFNNTIGEGYGTQSAINLQLEGGETGPYPIPGQIQNLWVWSNTLEGSPVEPYVREGFYDSELYIQEGRDYFLEPKPGYIPYPYPHPLVSETSSQSCASQSGTCCQSSQTCTGTNVLSSDCGWDCCIDGSCQSPPQDTCQSLNFDCCQTCQAGTEQPAYDADCPGAEVCCGTCQTQQTYPGPGDVVEAEDGQLTSPIAIGSDPAASGGEYVYTGTVYQGQAGYTFQIDQPGSFRLEAMINSRGGDGSNSFFVGLDQEDAANDEEFTWDTTEGPSWDWDVVSLRGPGGDHLTADFDPKVWVLSQGLHTFTFYGREPTWLDQLKLVRHCHRADIDCGVCIDNNEIVLFIGDWKQGLRAITMMEIMDGIRIWKAGQGCP
jgi:hypothetical protein